ncbi:MAG: DUF4349 domain-containing protein [Oscillospiraceae bacterium]|jgi:hypothetical protein|nr:DUF4349 domain-containing protein [Oscillospiraceae bacterium]
MTQWATATLARGSRGGWKSEEVAALQTAIERANQSGEPLRGVFDDVSRLLGRKPNSIRNYYYAQLKNVDFAGRPRATPFKAFDQQEIRAMLKEILRGCASGSSVRACVANLAQGDKTRMLRYQNKYRSLIKSRPELVREVMQELEDEGVRCRDPFMGRGARVSMAQTESRIRESGDPALQQLLSGLNALLSRAADPEQALMVERMQARQDIIQSELNETRTRLDSLRAACEAMCQTIQAYSAQTMTARRNQINEFTSALTERCGAIESALQG